VVLAVLCLTCSLDQLQREGVHPVADVAEEILGYPSYFLKEIGHDFGVEVGDWMFGVL
jgi:hypothetical protein